MSKQRSIILRDWEVRAIREGRKTELLREVKFRHSWEVDERDGTLWPMYPCYVTGLPEVTWLPCPFGQPGDPKREVKWVSAQQMKQPQSRLTLTVTSVRVMRLRDVSDEQAKAIGIQTLPLQSPSDPSAWWESEPGKDQARSPLASLKSLWQRDHSGSSLDANLWVWTVSFEKQ